MRSHLSNFLTLLTMYHITFYTLIYNTLYYITSPNFTNLHFIHFTLLQINFHYIAFFCITYFNIRLLCFTLLIITFFRFTIYILNSSRSDLSNHKSRVFKTEFHTLTMPNREGNITGLTRILYTSFTASQSSQYQQALAL